MGKDKSPEDLVKEKSFEYYKVENELQRKFVKQLEYNGFRKKEYYSNDDATAFTSEEVQINSLSPEEVLNALIEKGAIAADVEILSFETTTVDGKSTILLDFNDAFASYISSMGSTGEYFVMGSICNTFLDAYDCEQIQVTVDGDTLSTGHAEYPGYMTTFS